MSDCGRIPANTKEMLLEHLHAVICSLESHYASRVTGMLAELDVNYLMKLLGSSDLLKQTVADAVDAIQKMEAIERSQMNYSGRQAVKSTCERESLGETLFQEVHKLEPDHCAQITGMLLEIGPAAVVSLLADPMALKTAVARAKMELQRRQQCSDQLAETVYSAVSKVYPCNASKITGMLCEGGTLVNMGSTNEQLQVAMEMCKKALVDTGQWHDE